MWGHAMVEARGRQEESGRHEGGHVDVIVALTHFAPWMLHTRDSLEATQGTREGEENALKRGNDKFHCFVLRARELICSPLAYLYSTMCMAKEIMILYTHIFLNKPMYFLLKQSPGSAHIFNA
ncbi:hypothetical protein VPH35_088694 [Triticum aestivum]